MKKRSLYPVAEPIKINPLGVLVMSFTFALAFFIIGFVTVHYPSMAGVI